MERFENAQVGDLVYCRVYGDGEIVNKKETSWGEFLIIVKFNLSGLESYFVCGRFGKGHTEPILFYRKGEDRYLTERPEPDVDWSTVAPGTVCLVSHNNINEAKEEREFLCYVSGQKWFTSQYINKAATVWNYARIKP